MFEVDGVKIDSVGLHANMSPPVVDHVWLGGVPDFLDERLKAYLTGHYMRGCLAQVTINSVG